LQAEHGCDMFIWDDELDEIKKNLQKSIMQVAHLH